MNYAAKRWNRMAKWCEDNPAELFADYRDELPAHMAQMILDGEFDEFWGEVREMEFQATDYPEFWTYWEDEFADEFGYDSFDDMPERVKDIAFENRWIDSRDFVRTITQNTTVHINAILHKRDGELIYAPNAMAWDAEEYERARYVKRAFGIDGRPAKIAYDIDAIYGGCDMECAVVIGTLDLWTILENRKLPTHITVGPCDADNLLFYEFFNGAGNMGALKIQKERKFPATFHVDGSRGYGIDSCYGFVGSVWRHELRVS